jgi:hypothetical protein
MDYDDATTVMSETPYNNQNFNELDILMLVVMITGSILIIVIVTVVTLVILKNNMYTFMDTNDITTDNITATKYNITVNRTLYTLPLL